ncbi:PilW family protein [Undibacterium sp. RuTC16W]|uniref:PilW family protein n=1 Tax=Undibacterium sp. RuTC16W TaxID=3413048 RepID=UPI003BF3B62B
MRLGNSINLKKQLGLTLVELMISIGLGLLVVLSATALVVSTKTLFMTQTDGNDTQDTARFALDNISRQLRQTGFVNYDFSNSPQVTPSTASADLGGLDANSVTATSTDISSPLGSAVNFSDVLAVRFFGSGASANGDGTMSNCAGFSVPAPVSSNTADQDRGWSIYYVGKDANNEPELICKYYDSVNGNWNAQSIVKGVESFQVLYGLDTNVPPDGLANKFLTATDINALDNTLVLVGATAAAKAADKNKKTYWKKILSVKIALLVRGKEKSRTDVTTTVYDLFGADYAAANGATDKGTTIKEQDLPTDTIDRVRKVFTTTIQMRNVCIVDVLRGTCSPPNT